MALLGDVSQDACGAVRPSALITLFAGLLLIIPAWLGLFVSGVPTWISPFPILTSLPALFAVYRGSGNVLLVHAVLIIPVALFLLWNPKLFLGAGEPPVRTVVLLASCTVLTVFWFDSNWNFAPRYHSVSYVHGMLLANLVWLAALWIVWMRRWPSSSFYGNLLWHWALFAWLSWYAFPYLGELP